MPYIKEIYQNLNLKYLDFLEQNLFQNKDAIKEILELNSRSDFNSTYKVFDSSIYSNKDFKNSFYIGHIELKSLLSSEAGQKIAFSILDHRARLLNSIFEQFMTIYKKNIIF